MYRDNMHKVELLLDYIKNPDEIVSLSEKYADRFSVREPGKHYNFSTAFGSSRMKSMFYFNMPDELKLAIFKTLPEDDRHADSYLINRYDPGDYLPRHTDAQGAYWKFKLIFLQADAPHFVYYDNDGEHLVDESPGACLKFPINLEHEVTRIADWERPKYSLVLAWS